MEWTFNIFFKSKEITSRRTARSRQVFYIILLTNLPTFAIQNILHVCECLKVFYKWIKSFVCIIKLFKLNWNIWFLGFQINKNSQIFYKGLFCSNVFFTVPPFFVFLSKITFFSFTLSVFEIYLSYDMVKCICIQNTKLLVSNFLTASCHILLMDWIIYVEKYIYRK